MWVILLFCLFALFGVDTSTSLPDKNQSLVSLSLFSLCADCVCRVCAFVLVSVRLSPEIFLKRPVVEGNRWRLDCILKRKAVRNKSDK